MPHEKKWGNSSMRFIPLTDNPEMTKYDGLDFDRIMSVEERIQEEKERRAIYKHIDELREQDLDMLFQNMRKYIEGWWD